MDSAFSEYYKQLPETAQHLYRQKLTFRLNDNEEVVLPDPFSCRDWKDDPTKWPNLQFGDIYNFLIYTTGLYIFIKLLMPQTLSI